MERFRVTFKKSVANDLRSIPNADVKPILDKTDTLLENPRAAGCIKLSAQERYRVRQGLCRIIYEIRDELLVIHIAKIGHRSVAYKGN
jgi:mRNA interferase RelE/StbE